MGTPSATDGRSNTGTGGTTAEAAGRRRHGRPWLFYAGLVLTFLFVAYLTVPLGALYFRAPLRMLKTAECCYLVQAALVLSLGTSLATTFLTFLVGTPVAWTIARRQFPGRRLLETLIELPLTLPPVVAGVALLLAFGRRGYLGQYLSVLGIELPFTPIAVVMAQFMVASPHYIKTAIAAFESVPEDVIRASRTLGAGPGRTLFRIIVPMSRNMLLAGLALTWARSIGEFGATVMFAGNFPGRTQTMPLAILTTIQQDLHAGYVLAVVMLTVCLAIFFLVRKLVGSTPGLPGPGPAPSRQGGRETP